MGRFGRLSVLIPEGVKVDVSGLKVTVSGPKGELSRSLPRDVIISVEGNNLSVQAKNTSKQSLSDQGTTRSHLVNMIKGVNEGWVRTLEINGPGFRGEVKDKELILTLGYSHPVVITAPDQISFKIEKSIITVTGLDKEVVGQVAATIRAARRPDPYKAHGIKYTDEIIKKKAGKQATGSQG